MTVAIQIDNLTKRYPTITGYADLLPDLITEKVRGRPNGKTDQYV